jgi:cytochrome P450
MHRNLLIILFGGISTVEALILNALWVLFNNLGLRETILNAPDRIADLLEETMRWLSPVQSATRHVVADTEYANIFLSAGETINCMLGAANHDPAVFPDPERFDLARPNAKKHLGFAIGPHSCIGLHLAKLEARIALETLMRRLPGLALVSFAQSSPEGNEFRQPRRMDVVWPS